MSDQHELFEKMMRAEEYSARIGTGYGCRRDRIRQHKPSGDEPRSWWKVSAGPFKTERAARRHARKARAAAGGIQYAVYEAKLQPGRRTRDWFVLIRQKKGKA